MFVLEPGAETPIFMPFRSLPDLYAAAFAVAMPTDNCGARPMSAKHCKFWFFACILMVCS